MEDMKEFVAYSRKLLRSLMKIQTLLNSEDAKDIEEAKNMLDDLIKDTKSDIEA